MGLPGGWCSCIIYTVIYISTITFVHCDSTSAIATIEQSVLPYASETSQSITTSMLPDIENTLSSTVNTIQNYETSSMSLSSSSPSLQFSSSDTYSSVLLTEGINTSIKDSATSMAQSQSMSPSVLSSMSSSISPSQTIIDESSATVNSSNSTELESTTSIQPSVPTISSTPETSKNINTSDISSGSSSEDMVQTSMMTSSSTPVIATEIVSSSTYDNPFYSSSQSDVSSSFPEQSTQETTSMPLPGSSSSKTMVTSSSDFQVTEMTTAVMSRTQSPTLSLSLSSDSSSTSRTSESSGISNQVTSTVTILPTSSVELTASSSTAPTTLTTTTPKLTTTNNLVKEETLDHSNVFKVPTNFSVECSNFSSTYDIRQYILDKNIKGVRNVNIKNGCPEEKNRRKRDTTDSRVIITAVLSIDYGTNAATVAQDIKNAFQNNTTVTLESNGYVKFINDTLGDLCNTDICDRYSGYNCNQTSNNSVTCTSMCRDVDCSKHGYCKITTSDGINFGTKCVCDSEEYYNYEGKTCQDKRMKWELAVAIAGGAAGGIILILIFALIISCCCKSKDDPYKYRRDSYEPMSEIVGKPIYYRNDGPKTHQTGFSNFGYENDYKGDQERPTNDSWNPEESKDTYAKISEQLGQENTFQIKRPQVAGSRKSQLNEERTGF